MEKDKRSTTPKKDFQFLKRTKPVEKINFFTTKLTKRKLKNPENDTLAKFGIKRKARGSNVIITDIKYLFDKEKVLSEHRKATETKNQMEAKYWKEKQTLRECFFSNASQNKKK